MFASLARVLRCAGALTARRIDAPRVHSGLDVKTRERQRGRGPRGLPRVRRSRRRSARRLRAVRRPGAAGRPRARARHQGEAVATARRPRSRPSRRAPTGSIAPCPHFGACGGCRWQDLDYERAAACARRSRSRDALERIGHQTDFVQDPIVPAIRTYGYRNKLEFSFARDRGGPGARLPPRRPLGRDPARQACLLIGEAGNEARRVVEAWAAAHGAADLGPAQQRGLPAPPRRAARSDRTGELLLTLVTAPGELPQSPGWSTSWPSACPAASACCTPPPSGVAEVTHGLPTTLVFGRDWYEERLLGLRLKVSAGAFLQTNTEMCEHLYEIAIEEADLGGDEIVWDLYSGIGSIALAMAGAPGTCTASRSCPRPSSAPSTTPSATASMNAEFVQGDVAKAVRPLLEAGMPQPGRGRARPAARRADAEGGAARARARAAADHLRLVQPDHARRQRRAARRGRLPAGARAAGRHVPAHAPRRVRRAVRGRSQLLAEGVGPDAREVASAARASWTSRSATGTFGRGPVAGGGMSDQFAPALDDVRVIGARAPVEAEHVDVVRAASRWAPPTSRACRAASRSSTCGRRRRCAEPAVVDEPQPVRRDPVGHQRRVVMRGGDPSFIAVRFARTRHVRPRSVDASRRKRSARARFGRSTIAHHVVPLRAILRTRPVILGRVHVRHPFDESARRLARVPRRRAGWPSRPRTRCRAAGPRGRSG